MTLIEPQVDVFDELDPKLCWPINLIKLLRDDRLVSSKNETFCFRLLLSAVVADVVVVTVVVVADIVVVVVADVVVADIVVVVADVVVADVVVADVVVADIVVVVADVVVANVVFSSWKSRSNIWWCTTNKM